VAATNIIKAYNFSPTSENIASEERPSHQSIVVLRPPPRTDIPVIDQYYSQVDTVKEVGSIQFKSVYLRLLDKVERFWHAKSTGKAERQRIKSQLAGQLDYLDSQSEDTLIEQMHLLDQIEKYITIMKEFYEIERNVTSAYM
jgi:hypothetical protein